MARIAGPPGFCFWRALVCTTKYFGMDVL